VAWTINTKFQKSFVVQDGGPVSLVTTVANNDFHEREEQVDKLALLMGLEKVGWIYGHPPWEKGIDMDLAEVIMTAEI
jgi:hypothetical protein